MTVSLSASVLIALSCSFLSCVGLCAVLLPPAERVMARRRVAVVEVPSWRKRQQDLPPVGGIAIIVSAAAGILISAVFGGSVSENCIFLLIVAVLFSAVGLTDDLLTLTQNRRFSMHSSVKTVLRALLAVGFAVYSYNYNGGGYVPLSVFASRNIIYGAGKRKTHPLNKPYETDRKHHRGVFHKETKQNGAYAAKRRSRFAGKDTRGTFSENKKTENRSEDRGRDERAFRIARALTPE